MNIMDPMPVRGWARIRDPRSNGGEPVTLAYVNLRQASGLGVHAEGDKRVLKARFPDGSERTLDAEFPDDAEAAEVLVVLLKATVT